MLYIERIPRKEIPRDGAMMTVFALGKAGAKVMDRIAAEWPESAQQVEWLCYRIDHKGQAYSNACADPDFCTGLAGRAGAGVISREKWDGILDRMETLMGWKAHLGNCERHNCICEYLMILVDQKQRFDFLAAASLAKIARGQGYVVIGVITTEEPGNGDALTDEALQEERRLFSEAADCTICLPRTAKQAPESLLWPTARAFAIYGSVGSLIGLDFADIKDIFQSGKNAWISTGRADEMDAAVDELFASSAFVKHVQAASGALLFCTIPPDADISLGEIDQAANRVLNAMDDPEADFVWGVSFVKTETDRVCVTLIVIDDDRAPPFPSMIGCGK